MLRLVMVLVVVVFTACGQAAAPAPPADAAADQAGGAQLDTPAGPDAPPSGSDVTIPYPGYEPIDVTALPGAAWVDVTKSFGFLYFSKNTNHGFCTIGADLDGDDWDDLLVVRSANGSLAVDVALLHGGAPIHVLSPFYGSPKFSDVGCAAADMDDDGLLDLLFGTVAGFTYLHNDGKGAFSDRTDKVLPPVMDFAAASAAWADFDGDGQSEIFVGAGSFYGSCDGFSCAYAGTDFHCQDSGKVLPDASMQDRMFSKSGGQWVDATAKWALAPGGWLTEVTAVDIDQDGAMDVLVGNDKADHLLLHNEGGGLKKYATDIGFLPYAHHMGWGVGDLDGDGLLDLTMGDAGPMPLYLQKKPAGSLPLAFDEVAAAWGLAAATHDLSCWDPLLVDFDQDGWLDIYIGVAALAPAGSLEQLASCQAQPKVPQRDLYFRNLQGKGFEPFNTPIPIWQTMDFTAVAQTAVDIDRDGDLDILQVRRDGFLRILRNDLAKPGTSVVVRLKGKPGNTAAVGTRLVAEIAGKKQVRQLIGNSGFGGTGLWSVHFGLGSAARVDKLTVTWPGGKTSVHGPIAAGERIVLTAP